MSQMPPQVASSQPVRALQMANGVRRARSMLKTRIAQGQLEAAEVILTCPSDSLSALLGGHIRPPSERGSRAARAHG